MHTIKIARVIKDTIANNGFVARLSGDEYLIHLGADLSPKINILLEDLLLAIKKTSISSGELRISRTASLGFICIRSDMTPQNAIIEANRALTFAKQSGKNQIIRSPERSASLPAQLPSLEEVRLGLQREEIGYYVQPIFKLETMEVVGYEALLRWHRRNGEIIGPAQFVHTMTRAYDEWAEPPLKAAYETAVWAVLKKEKFISFNISGAFLKKVSDNGLSWINTIVGDVPWNRVIFELVETIIDTEENNIANIIIELRSQGVRIALDDFGTGQSTLGRLQKIHVDMVKIDRSFLHAAIESERDANILKGMIDLATTSGAETVLEGVESEAQLQLARLLGASYAQGFYLGEPAPIK